MGKKANFENIFILLFMYAFALAFVILGSAMIWGAFTGELNSLFLSIVIGLGMIASGILIFSYPLVSQIKKKAKT